MNLTFKPFSLATLEALALGDAIAAGERFGQVLPAELVAETSVWSHYAELLTDRPEVEGWITEALLKDDLVVGYAGFHEPPNEAGEVELGYTVLAPFRGGGIATAAVALLVSCAEQRDVGSLTGYAAPENEASIAVLRSNGFSYVRDIENKHGHRQLMFERRFHG